MSHSHHERHTSEETGAGRRQRNQRLKPSSPLRNHGDATTPTAHKGKKELVIFDSGMGALEAPLCISRDLLGAIRLLATFPLWLCGRVCASSERR